MERPSNLQINFFLFLFLLFTLTHRPFANNANSTRADFILLTNSSLIACFPSSYYLLKINYRNHESSTFTELNVIRIITIIR